MPSLLESAKSFFSAVSPADLATVTAQLRTVTAEHQFAKSHRGQSYRDGDPRQLDHEIVTAEWDVQECELRERLNEVDPVPAALRSHLIAALQTARDGLAELDNAVKEVAPKTPGLIDRSSLAALSDRYLHQTTVRKTDEQRRADVNARLHADMLAYFACLQAAGEARTAAKLPGFRGQAGDMYLSALAQAASLGKADVRTIDERLRALGEIEPETNGALYAARCRLKVLQDRRQRLEDLQVENARKAAAYDDDRRRARGAGVIG